MPRWPPAGRPRRPRSPARRNQSPRAPPSEDPPILPNATGAQANVHVREPDPEQAEPRPGHVLAVQAARTLVGLVPEWGLRHLVQAAADEMSERVAPERVPAEQDHVNDQHERPQADPERSLARG